MKRTEPLPDAPAGSGLCDACRHARRVASRRNRFLLCKRSLTDARYPRYPRLPVLNCDGFVPLPSRDARSGGSGR